MLPRPTREEPCCRALTELAPRFADALDRALERVPNAMVAETTRTDARQQWLYAFGRTVDDGRGVVTHSASALDTWHHYGLAADVIHATLGWTAPSSWWQQLGIAARGQGLAWGGDWPTFPDRPHIQWGAPMRRSPSPSAAQLLAAGGRAAVWHAVGAVYGLG